MALIEAMASAYTLPGLPLRDVGLFVDGIPTVNTVIEGADRRSFGGRFWGPSISPVLTPNEFDCETDEDLSADMTLNGSDAFMPWTVTAGITCSTVPPDDTGPSLLEMSLDEVRKSLSASLAFAATQTSPTFVNLSDSATDLGGYGTAADTFQAIEEGLADEIGNRRGYIIMNVGLLAKALDAGAVERLGTALRTPSGHIVIADAGALAGVVYGVGQIAYSMSDARLVDPNGSLDITRDTITYLAQAEGLIVYNPATVVSAEAPALVEAS